MIKRGDIYYIRDTRQSVGSEQRADRPAVIVSNNTNNKHSGVYEVVYMTTQPKTDLPTHFIIASALKPSTVLCEQISSVYEERIGEWIGTLTPDEMKTLDQCLAVSIGIKADVQPAEDTENLRQQLETTEAKLAEMGGAAMDGRKPKADIQRNVRVSFKQAVRSVKEWQHITKCRNRQ